MEFTKKEILILAPGCIEKYQYYKLALDAIGCLMKKACVLYVKECNTVYASQVENTVLINSVSSKHYNVPRKHPVKLKVIKRKRGIFNKIETSRIDVQIVAFHPEGNKTISLQKCFDQPAVYTLDFLLENYIYCVKDESVALTKKSLQLINTLNQLSDEISNSLEMLLESYGQFIVDSEIKPHSSQQLMRLTNMDFVGSIEKIYSQLFMHHKGFIDDLFMYINEFKERYYSLSKAKVAKEGVLQKTEKKANNKYKEKPIFNPVSFRSRIGTKYKIEIPNGDLYLTNLTLEVRLYTSSKTNLSKNLKPITREDGTKKFILEMILCNNINSVPQHLAQIVEEMIDKLNYFLTQKKQVFAEIHSLRNLLNMMDKSNEHITLIKRK